MNRLIDLKIDAIVELTGLTGREVLKEADDRIAYEGRKDLLETLTEMLAEIQRGAK